ncbi:hypothetical protein K431DRAFT_242657, partial [Polychaeton citri CBS 116435]
MLHNTINSRDIEGDLQVEHLVRALANCADQGQPVALHVRAQNAGVLISNVESGIQFEVFELSPVNNEVHATQGRLRRHFPGKAVIINAADFSSLDLRHTIAQTLATMSHQDATGTKSQVKKAGQMRDEERDTVHPRLVTELFVAFLETIGKAVSVPSLSKNTREEVLWKDVRLPWRRSALWLLIRVSLQCSFERQVVGQTGSCNLYKQFMLFHMGCLLAISRESMLESDLLYMMNAKVVRRLLKLGSVTTPSLHDALEQQVKDTTSMLEKRWATIQKQHDTILDFSWLGARDFQRDTTIHLPALNEFIQTLSQLQHHPNRQLFIPRSSLQSFDTATLPVLHELTTDENYINLQAFEEWVILHLSSWTLVHINDVGACTSLETLIKQYHRIASPTYRNNPEAISIMSLTILQLFVAMDQCAVSRHPTLLEYDTGIPKGCFESLLLPNKYQMEILQNLEVYLGTRRRTARHQWPALLDASGRSTSSFAVRYFDQSSQHQALLRDIEAKATRAKEAKLQELRKAKKEYARLMRLHEEAAHEYQTVVTDHFFDNGKRRNVTEEQHRVSCTKCSWKSKAQSLRIGIHEWPLPNQPKKAKIVVFELDVPLTYRAWRDTLIFLRLDILGDQYSRQFKSENSYKLAYDPQLASPFAFGNYSQRIGLTSESKSNLTAHYRDIPASTATESKVCLTNGLDYKYFDNLLDCFVTELKSTNSVTEACTYKLPANSQALQAFMFRPASLPNGEAPNMVIASQHKCAENMTLDEYKKLGTIPLGTKLTWLNILRELDASSLNLKRPETALVIFQCIYQAGPSASDGGLLRTSHEVTQEHGFAHAILTLLGRSMERITGNWESFCALSIHISIARRLLSLSDVTDTKKQCFTFLDKARLVALDWMKVLRQKASAISDNDARVNYLTTGVEVALICLDTFNVDAIHLSTVLGSQVKTSIFFQCSMFVAECRGLMSQGGDSRHLTMHGRYLRSLQRCYRKLASAHEGLNDAIAATWTAYRPGTGWAIDRFDHWLTSTTSPEHDGRQRKLHYNVLSGELLVDGLPLDRLPREYEDNPSFCTLFGSAYIEVVPPSMPGMQFAARKEHASYSIELGLGIDTGSRTIVPSDLLVSAIRGNSRFWLIPVRFFEHILPASFLTDYVHWYDIEHGLVRFCPIDNCWDILSTAAWTLSRSRDDLLWQMAKDGESLLELKTETARTISRIMSPLTVPHDMHTMWRESTSTLEVKLHSLQLRFRLKRGEPTLQSLDFNEMCFDTDQSLGTLIGLSSKIVMKHSESGDRAVLIAEGTVRREFDRQNSHTAVAISYISGGSVQLYRVDVRLGRLVDNGSLQSKLFLAYLHALTSFCLPDPLTSRTGTEQALTVLNSAATRSFERLSQGHLNLLTQIDGLTAKRRYYPKHKREMQTVHWRADLSTMSHHPRFHEMVVSMLSQASNSNIFYPDAEPVVHTLSDTERSLLERDAIRSSSFRVADFGAEDFTVAHDKTYASRDSNRASPAFTRAFNISSTVQQHLSVCNDFPTNLGAYLWTAMSKCGTVAGSNATMDFASLRFDAVYLEESAVSWLFQKWATLHRRLHSDATRFNVMIWLSTLAFNNAVGPSILQCLALFYTCEELRGLQLPSHNNYAISQGRQPDHTSIGHTLQQFLTPLNRSPENTLQQADRERAKSFHVRRQHLFTRHQQLAINAFIQGVSAQWPNETPVPPQNLAASNASAYIDISGAVSALGRSFQSWYRNLEYWHYLGATALCMTQQPQVPQRPVAEITTKTAPPRLFPRRYISLEDFFTASVPDIHECGLQASECRLDSLLDVSLQENEKEFLVEMIDDLDQLGGDVQYTKQYVRQLKKSYSSFAGFRKGYKLVKDHEVVRSALIDHLGVCGRFNESAHRTLTSCLTSASHIPNAATASAASFGPRISTAFLLQQLSQTRWSTLCEKWKEAIVTYSISVTALQQAERLFQVHRTGTNEDLINELLNLAHQNWKPVEYPQWLLMEAENNITIRPVQASIAITMLHTPKGNNTCLQLNMGEGKSSTIVPMVASVRSDGLNLARVIVAKPQSRQMAQMMISRLGGLINKRIFALPISRSFKPDESTADAIFRRVKECVACGGVLLVQPEHILSFKLMGIESFLDGNQSVGISLLESQDYLDQAAQDIVDESDEIYSAKFELIYTVGTQQPIDASPGRWTLIHQVLAVFRSLATFTADKFPTSIEMHDCQSGAFPRTRFLQPEAQEHLLNRVASYICENGLEGFNINRQNKHVRRAVFTYITKPQLATAEVEDVQQTRTGLLWTGEIKDALLLLRGLFADSLLAFSFGRKRWRVDYGLDHRRNPPTSLAVPYRAKDVPSPRSEFSHPDVVIILTTLSYYYGGLTLDDLTVAFEHLIKSDQADIKYSVWVKDAGAIPTALATLQGISLRDKTHFEHEVFPHFRHVKAVVDYFLANIIFPKQMKEFPSKLSASGWDLSKVKNHATVGFSGTNDLRIVLPLDVTHEDLQEQSHTNALVLDYLLQSDNSVALIAQVQHQHETDAMRLLKMVEGLEPVVQVILDVGAQVIELDNFGVAEQWLSLNKSEKVKAVVFVDENDDVVVLDRKGRVEHLQTSPFATQHGECLVYLDEAHTRGIDLRLPQYYRAAVTLGANVTKDKLVQACMRMRKLGKGQTVVFCVPEEIQSKIRQTVLNHPGSDISVSHVLKWAVRETWEDIQRTLPLWAVQGRRYIKQRHTWDRLRENHNTVLSKESASKFLEDESQTLEDRYLPRIDGKEKHSTQNECSNDLDEYRIQERCALFENLHYSSSALLEEQERELRPETEQEAQIQRPSAAQPEKHSLHTDVVWFARYGDMRGNSAAYLAAFDSLANTTAAKDFSVSQMTYRRTQRLYVTKDFTRTVKMTGCAQRSDSFQRWVQWVLTSTDQTNNSVKHMMIISPFEANELIDIVRDSKNTTLHVFTPRWSLEYGALDRLGFYSIPERSPALSIPDELWAQLVLFSGQLYLSSYKDYTTICEFLGLAVETKDNWDVAADGFVLRDDQDRVGLESGLTSSPVPFLQTLMTRIRRDGEGISRTHMGDMLNGSVLHPDDFE